MELPDEVLEIIRCHEIPNQQAQNNETIQSFARILPLAPHLSSYLEHYLRIPSGHAEIQWLKSSNPPDLAQELQRILLAAFRLLSFDCKTYSRTISSSKIQSLFKHGDRAVRYLAVRVFCRLRSAADFKLEQLINEHIGKEKAVMGDYDGELVDYGFLGLWEERRLRHGTRKQHESQQAEILNGRSPVSRIVLPRPNGPSVRPSKLVPTPTTSRNIQAFAKALISSSPVLLHGLAGSGKTSLVNDFARELNVDSTMITLHLNEQTDAKMLIGMYMTGSMPGSFTWRPGVLTTAVREGRWVFIEDLDRAPNEVISVILPLIERRELLIPSRGETVTAASGFKLFASIRTSLSVTGHENAPALHMLGARLWQRVPVEMPDQDEFRQIIHGTHPILDKFLPRIINVYERLCQLTLKPYFASRSRTSLGRPISPRDLLKWCRRLEKVLKGAGSKTGAEPILTATEYDMFLEATDCFASSLQTEDARRSVVICIAEELQIDPQRVEHFITSYVPKYENRERELSIGRASLPKRSSGRVTKTPKTRPFATTKHAKRLLEQVGVAVSMSEPVLLVGETGIGKTTVVQQLADSLGFKLTAVNLSQQSEVGDLLGGFKPVNVRNLAIPLREEFDDLLLATNKNFAAQNPKFIEQLVKYMKAERWREVSKLWRKTTKVVENIISHSTKDMPNGHDVTEQPAKRRKKESKFKELQPRLVRFREKLDQFDVQLSGGPNGFAFTFVEGNMVKAARNGDWVLLDEINLASPDTLESIADLLHSGSGNPPSILLSETGEIERVVAHPNFRIFGAMNPATDVGKRDLPMGLRSRFTEIYVESPDKDLDDLLAVIKVYIKGTSSNDERAAGDVARLYLNTKRLADEKQLVDGANQVPHFSLRTLTRVLSYVTEIAPSYGLRRSLYEGFAMGFLTLLDRESEKMLTPLIEHHLLSTHANPKSLLSQTPRHPEDGKQYVRFVNKNRDRQYWMLQGMETLQQQPHYIITPFVERNMLNLVRATSTRRFPVLVQGPTSSGKTSMIEYLAKFSGNKFVRINNHEHTDLQEYLGTYASGSDGKLQFHEGLLVQALRMGHWIVLDELNLAPTDVLEALNRLLDDNRELLIPETQETVRPHENFMLFATQNPPGLYGGRKTLSRAFRNRFLELHFDDIPEEELDHILEKRSQKVAPSDCKRIVSVYKELSRLRQSNRLFEQKDSFATLRDLFRWALRDAKNREELAANGYMLLGERVRNPEERLVVKEVIEKVFKVKIDPAVLYDANFSPEIAHYNNTQNTQGVVWTNAMRRLFVLVAHALRNNEPVLLVGETGCGKTMVCQMLADAFKKELHIVNAHQNTETGDLIGAQRPVRNRAVVLEQLRKDILLLLQGLGQSVQDSQDLNSLIGIYRSLADSDLAKAPEELLLRITSNKLRSKALFEWADGSLIQAMKQSQFFLLDEISLADDSVLERLNSVLETQRTILLAEKGGAKDSFVQAADGFQFFATMNPGGDYGKRELSPALRNRFTEIWVPSLSEHDDVLKIVEAKLDAKFKPLAAAMVHFAEWFGQAYRSSSATSISIRDVLAWVKFMNGCRPASSPYFAVLHGAAMVYIDTLGANPAALLAINPESIIEERSKCLKQLDTLLGGHDLTSLYHIPVEVVSTDHEFAVGEFTLLKDNVAAADPGFAFGAPTTKLNAMRVLRALRVQKPVLIEGSPGVGKTTLIAALARACGKSLTRINLSEQTDLMDLFGSDVPDEGAEVGHFSWRDAPFLQAMQRGEWVLLDEMNLASQSVLEGLNACLDHRGEVYISELDQTFKRHPNFCVFAAQNPHHQGGGRKGLPSSFVNRFTVVYADVLRDEDLRLICKHNFPALSKDITHTIIRFVSQLEHDIVYKRKFGAQGGPWEFNLRDILRWLQLLASNAPLLATSTPSDFLNLIFRLRFRTTKDRQELDKIFSQVFGVDVPFRHFFYNLSSDAYQVGLAYLRRDTNMQRLPYPSANPVNRLPEIESVIICIQQNIPCILVGPSGSGKSTILQHIAAISGKSLVVFPLNADIDTMDIVGGFEQVDPQREASAFLTKLTDFLNDRLLESLPAEIPAEVLGILELLGLQNPTSASLFVNLARLLEQLAERISLADFKTLSDTCKRFADTPLTLESARFEWVDGVLVKALEQGQWLVLDNANLCSASVLDRLNSLLEPDGFLSINEHCGPDGEPKVVKPHPDFRIFLTMDPRFGELSRAMRNRTVEIYLEPMSADISVDTSMLAPQPASSMQRYGGLLKLLESSDHKAISVGLDSLSWSDMAILPRFTDSVKLLDQQLVRRYMQIYQDDKTGGFRAAVGEVFDHFENTTVVTRFWKDSQTFHPLQNSALVKQLSSSSDQILWLGVSFDLKSNIYEALDCLNRQEQSVGSLKPSQMNRLQRSVARSLPSVVKDSTVGVHGFLTSLLNTIDVYIQKTIRDHENWQSRQKALNMLLNYWWNTYYLSTMSTNFEEATFQAHLAIGADMAVALTNVNSSGAMQSVVDTFRASLRQDFDSGFKLTTGLSMELLWKELRPIVISTEDKLDILVQIEGLALRFDALRWKVSSISPATLGSIMESLVKAYHTVLTSATDIKGAALVQTLTIEMNTLEGSVGGHEDGLQPFMASQFEALRQFVFLDDMRADKYIDSVDVELAVLSNHPTTSNMQLITTSEPAHALQSVNYLWGSGTGLYPVSDTFSADLLRKLNAIGQVDLQSLKLLQSELPILADKIVSSSGILSQDQFAGLVDILSYLIRSITSAHECICGSLRGSFESVCKSYFDPAVLALQVASQDSTSRLRSISVAWINFAIGAIALYVPDRSFDPDKRQRIQRERHVSLRDTLRKKLAALRGFELVFTGQNSNLRCQLLEAEIDELGEPAADLQEIYRPEASEMDLLQGEFKNVLKTVVLADLPANIAAFFSNPEEGALQEIKLVQNNVLQIIRRLSDRYRAYNDLIVPVISMLRCLQIGLFMATRVAVTRSQSAIVGLRKLTPFLGGGPSNIDETITSSYPMESLALLSTASAIEGVSSIDPALRQTLLKKTHECYEQWKARLESDRAGEEAKGGLYRFRGSEEDEEEKNQEELNELFPNYDNESADKASPASKNARDVAVQLAKVHSNIFQGVVTPSASVLSLIRQVSRKIGAVHEETGTFEQQNTARDLLPGTLLLLNDQIDALSAGAMVPESYNFYTDANLPEVRKLVTLIHQVQARFRELQAVDEIGHMQPLEDVLVSCREILQFQHTEPLAKIITKIEYLHGFMHEWQFGGWASRANSALPQYDNITATIVSWRSLELRTWAKLFDMEITACEDDARSWWFVAYEVIIAAPLVISESPDKLPEYSQKLLQDLETYFSSAVVGQFAQRLQLLKQLQKHLELLVLDVPSMLIIHVALTNFIELYSRYLSPVKENIRKGRLSLEKAMRDVVLLASWKDTNIVALRDSAKRSHHMLFKIVRKFRTLLGQPMEIFLKQGLPKQASLDGHDSNYLPPQCFPTVDQSALTWCASSLPTWFNKSKRFINVSKTVSLMADASMIPESVVEGSAYVDSFLDNIITSTAALQKATPSVLTEENTDQVKHLKTQKRKLFADTLKELRQMGIKYNLDVTALSKQDSLSIILTNTAIIPSIKGFDSHGLEYYYHMSLDLAARFRDAARQHSEDLSGAEVARSTGFLEGLLHALLSQRNVLASAVTSMERLEKIIKLADVLWAPEYQGIVTKQALVSSHGKLLQWVQTILEVALNLVMIHAKLGNMKDAVENGETSAVEAFISESINKFKELRESWDSSSQLPSHLTSTQRTNLIKKIDDATSQLRANIEKLCESRPDLSFILRQILPWTIVESSQLARDAPVKIIADLDSNLSTICDAILVAVEKHKEVITDNPTSTEEPSWLVKSHTTLGLSIKVLHCDTIVELIEAAFSMLLGIDLEDAATSKTACAIFAVAQPIFQQYFNILQCSVIRYAQLHRSTCKTAYVLSKTFIQIASQGFCTPSEKSSPDDGKTEKLEGGTGLGDGEGAEDISKDIQDDENLEELAQEANANDRDEIEDEKDAVDMADADMEGEMGDGEEKEDEDNASGNEEEGEDMDEETGDVDDLDPSALDEKMWDGDGEQAEKDQEGDDSKGKVDKDEQAAAQENNTDTAEQGAEGEDDEEESAGAEQGEEITQQNEVEKHDPHADAGEVLDLPEDMELDGEEEEGKDASDDDMNDLSDAEEAKEGDEVENAGKDKEDSEEMGPQEDQDMVHDIDIIDPDEQDEEEGGDKTEDAGDTAERDSEEQQPEDQEGLLRERDDEVNADTENAVPSDIQGVGEDQDETSNEEKNEAASKAQREDGGKGGDSSEQQEAAAEDGEKGRQAAGDAPQDARDETRDISDTQPFKKLGDALESWHRQQTQIREAAPEQKEQDQSPNMDLSKDSTEFQHLQDEEAQADTQAMGTATEEQAHAFDESMAVDTEVNEMPDQFQPDEVEEGGAEKDDIIDIENSPEPQEQNSDAYKGRAGAMINQAKQYREDDLDALHNRGQEDMEEDVKDVDNQLESTHLDDTQFVDLHSATDARHHWTQYEASTRDLSLSLTEQLRLILAPTLATKMRGDFRTGKRLNIKRIIPYIASQFKRDKIWMRRSVPSKRSYQIMLAVDDSKSMGESRSGELAFETLVMVSKSLSMLEVGEICVVGFGEGVKVAHGFDKPFSSDAGPKVFQHFSFQQEQTNITALVQQSIELFRAARAKASGGPADLWQMELIISDGVCNSSEHEPIRRLLREALEERIMMVFVIVDDLKTKKKGESVMDLRQAKFVKNEMTGNSEVKLERYLDTFPFQYYLIVSDVKELPGVLATLLRQWFAEVVDSGN